MSQNFSEWETIVGLEIHVELNTKSKMFSPAPNHFGDEPNTNIHAVCTGQPGALPVINRAAVDKAILFGCAVGAEVALFSKFDRKSYFYPDSPRNFQITQFDQPIVIGGKIEAEVDGQIKTFEIDHAHLEDDAGMLKHFTSFTGVDYNRAGVPLVEIVSKPCMHSAQDAVAYAMAIKAVMEYIDASDCNMEEGSLRFDANVSVRKRGEPGFRNKIEIKNMNSFYSLGMAIDAEVARQIRLYEAEPQRDPAEIIQPGTYRWDAEKGATVLMRRKERADDYRYFPEPDLPPLVLTTEYIERIREKLPELPYAKKKRYIEQLQLTEYSAGILTSDKKLADYFEEGLKHTSNARALCNWITVEFTGRFKEKGISVYRSGIASDVIAELVNLIDQGTITGKIAKSVADDMAENIAKRPKEIVAANPNYQVLNNTQEIEAIVAQVLAENPQSIEDYKAGKERAFGFLVGQVMKRCAGKAPPTLVNDLIKQKLV
ncbi:MAG: gatB [Chlamydiales bacterium]|jgi:aspartyl-tRNA(Asn)/glutamyl-tRNA(Gln) amidotransferase subunit B|nr:gatB [Chlamydiales bacterium]